MALVACGGCKGEVSDTAMACPKCGHALRALTRGPVGVVAKWLFILFNALMLAWLIGGLYEVSRIEARSDMERGARDLGASIGVAYIMTIWGVGAVPLGLLALLTRHGSSKPVAEVKRGRALVTLGVFLVVVGGLVALMIGSGRKRDAAPVTASTAAPLDTTSTYPYNATDIIREYTSNPSAWDGRAVSVSGVASITQPAKGDRVSGPIVGMAGEGGLVGCAFPRGASVPADGASTVVRGQIAGMHKNVLLLRDCIVP